MEARLVDTNIFIDIFRGNKMFLERIEQTNVYISDVIYIELIQGGLVSKDELRRIQNFIRPFNRIHISQKISITAVSLVEQFGSSHGLKLADSLIASTALTWGLPLVTMNRKDFRFINNLRLDNP